MESDGVVAVFSPGHYLATRTVNLHGAFSIEGNNATIHKATVGAALAINGGPGSVTSGFVVRDLRVTGDGKGDYGVTIGNGVGPVYSANGLIENVTVGHFKRVGLWFQASQLLTLVRVEANFNEAAGFLFDGQAGNNTTTNCYGCAASQNGVGVLVRTGYDLNFNGLTSESNRLEGVLIESQRRSVRQVHFSGCWIEQNNKARPKSKSAQFRVGSLDGTPIEGIILRDSTFVAAGDGNAHYEFGKGADVKAENLHLQTPER